MKPQFGERVLVRLVLDGYYSMDHDGRFWRMYRGVLVGAEHRTPPGYMCVRKIVDGRRVVAMSHRLVWQAHNGDIPDDLVINHLNGRKDDNRLVNLEVVTACENTQHAFRTGLKVQPNGDRNPVTLLSDQQVVEIRELYASGTHRSPDLARRFGASVSHVCRIIRGESRKHQGGSLKVAHV